MVGIGAAEWPVMVIVFLFRLVIPLALVCIAAYLGARKGAERALRDKRDDPQSPCEGTGCRR